MHILWPQPIPTKLEAGRGEGNLQGMLMQTQIWEPLVARWQSPPDNVGDVGSIPGGGRSPGGGNGNPLLPGEFHGQRSLVDCSPCMLHAKLLQPCLTLCAPMDCSLPGFSVHRIFQARILEWVATSSYRGSSEARNWTHIFYQLLRWQSGSLPLAPPGKPRLQSSPIFGVAKTARARFTAWDLR